MRTVRNGHSGPCASVPLIGSEPVIILTDSGEAYRIHAAVRDALARFGAKYVCSGDMPDFLADLDREFPALSAPLAQPTPSATDEET